MKDFMVRNCHINKGILKICVPLLGTTYEQLKAETDILKKDPVDIVEWRMDHFEHITDISQMLDAARMLRKELPDTVLLFTFRRFVEGGVRELDDQTYGKLYHALLDEFVCDMIDVEYSCGNKLVNDLITKAHANHIRVVISAHDFHKTPSYDAICRHYKDMEACGGDIVKMACMPQSMEDVFTMMCASKEASEHICKVPLISMSMGDIGMVSRVFAQMSGSALTFASMKEASAPGQLPYRDMKYFLRVLYETQCTE